MPAVITESTLSPIIIISEDNMRAESISTVSSCSSFDMPEEVMTPHSHFIAKVPFVLDTPATLDTDESLNELYSNRERLGYGSFGAVIAATHKLTGLRVALKCVDKKFLFTSTEKESVMKEAEFLYGIKHRNIVRMLARHETATQIIFVQELCTGGTVKSLMSKRRLMVPEVECKKIVKQMLGALSFLHRRGILHGDIKPENVLLGDGSSEGDICVKLCDFGSTQKIEADGKVSFTDGVGSLSYLAPELMRRERYGCGVDIWSVGIMMFEMLFGYHPFHPLESLLTTPVEFDAKYTAHASATAKRLIASLLERNDEKRLTADEALLDSWFDSE